MLEHSVEPEVNGLGTPKSYSIAPEPESSKETATEEQSGIICF